MITDNRPFSPIIAISWTNSLLVDGYYHNWVVTAIDPKPKPSLQNFENPCKGTLQTFITLSFWRFLSSARDNAPRQNKLLPVDWGEGEVIPSMVLVGVTVQGVGLGI